MKKLIGFQRGVNLGGWLSQGKLDKEHLDTFIVEDDIKRISEFGVDHVRLPVDYENIEDDNGNAKESGYEYIERCFMWCEKYGLNIVLDLHKTCGYAFDNIKESEGFFTNENLQNRFYRTWDNLSKHFAKYSHMVMFEMLNEVTKFEYSDSWNKIAKKCFEIIRKNAPTVKILLGGVGYSAVNAVKLLPLPFDENVVYNIHCYEPMIFTHQKAYWVEGMPDDLSISYPDSFEKYVKETDRVPSVRNGLFLEHDVIEYYRILGKEFFYKIFEEPALIASERNVALYCGEYGVIDRADPISSINWLKDINAGFEKYGIGRAIWSYKEMDFGIIGKHYEEVFSEIIKYL